MSAERDEYQCLTDTYEYSQFFCYLIIKELLLMEEIKPRTNTPAKSNIAMSIEKASFSWKPVIEFQHTISNN